MSYIKIVISQIKDEAEKPTTLIRRIINSIKWRITKISWSLWGRRKAFKKMQRLIDLTKEEERISNHRMRLDSFHVSERLPAPDAEDISVN